MAPAPAPAPPRQAAESPDQAAPDQAAESPGPALALLAPDLRRDILSRMSLWDLRVLCRAWPDAAGDVRDLVDLASSRALAAEPPRALRAFVKSGGLAGPLTGTEDGVRWTSTVGDASEKGWWRLVVGRGDVSVHVVAGPPWVFRVKLAGVPRRPGLEDLRLALEILAWMPRVAAEGPARRVTDWLVRAERLNPPGNLLNAVARDFVVGLDPGARIF